MGGVGFQAVLDPGFRLCWIRGSGSRMDPRFRLPHACGVHPSPHHPSPAHASAAPPAPNIPHLPMPQLHPPHLASLTCPCRCCTSEGENMMLFRGPRIKAAVTVGWVSALVGCLGGAGGW